MEQRSPWPWITGIIIIAGLLWFILTYVYVPYESRVQEIKNGNTYSGDKYIAPVDTLNEVKDFIAFSKRYF